MYNTNEFHLALQHKINVLWNHLNVTTVLGTSVQTTTLDNKNFNLFWCAFWVIFVWKFEMYSNFKLLLHTFVVWLQIANEYYSTNYHRMNISTFYCIIYFRCPRCMYLHFKYIFILDVLSNNMYSLKPQN